VNNPFVLWGVGLGIILALGYFILRLKSGKDRNIEGVVGVFGYAVGATGEVFRSVASL